MFFLIHILFLVVVPYGICRVSTTDGLGRLQTQFDLFPPQIVAWKPHPTVTILVTLPLGLQVCRAPWVELHTLQSGDWSRESSRLHNEWNQPFIYVFCTWARGIQLEWERISECHPAPLLDPPIWLILILMLVQCAEIGYNQLSSYCVNVQFQSYLLTFITYLITEVKPFQPAVQGGSRLEAVNFLVW